MTQQELLAATQRMAQGFNPPPQPTQDSMMYMPMGQGTVAMPQNGYISDADISRVQSLEKPLDAGPYAPNATGVTAQQYQEQLNSPYMTGLARTLAARGHNKIAGMFDSAALGATSAEASHEKALAAGGGVEGAGGGLADLFAGALGPSQMQLAHRQQLEELPLQYQTQEAQAAQERAKAIQDMLMGAHAAGQNQASVAAATNRMATSAGINATEHMQANANTQTNADWRAWIKANASLQGDRIRADVSAANGNSARLLAIHERFAQARQADLQKINGQADSQIRTLQTLLSVPGVDKDAINGRIQAIQQDAQAKTDQLNRYYDDQSTQLFGQGIPKHPQAKSKLPQGGGKQLDEQTAHFFLQQAGGDANKARKLAKQNGWKF